MFRRLSYAFLAAPVAAAAMIAPSVAAQPSDIARVADHLRALDTMTANFTQTDRSGNSLTGVLTLKRPGKVRFQYEQGVPQLLVADGSSLWFIDYEVKQVERWPIGEAPLGVLLDPSKDLAKIAKVVPSGDDRILLVEARDPEKPQFGTITLAFARSPGAPAGLMLQGWVALDSQNNRTTVRLSSQKFNVAVSDRTFRWNDPRPKARGR